MASVYILQGTTGRYYIGCTEDIEKRVTRHNSGMVHSTKRIGLPVSLIAYCNVEDMAKARTLEAKLKSWKNSKKALQCIRSFNP
ncbi:MAG TPA: hypothetical protein DCX06_05115 [Opitutae bacterium]|nr:hypothetical protein [Opitutae bacterium]